MYSSKAYEHIIPETVLILKAHIALFNGLKWVQCKRSISNVKPIFKILFFDPLSNLAFPLNYPRDSSNFAKN